MHETLSLHIMGTDSVAEIEFYYVDEEGTISRLPFADWNFGFTNAHRKDEKGRFLCTEAEYDKLRDFWFTHAADYNDGFFSPFLPPIVFDDSGESNQLAEVHIEEWSSDGMKKNEYNNLDS